jgi:hypothetical protein
MTGCSKPATKFVQRNHGGHLFKVHFCDACYQKATGGSGGISGHLQ